MPKISQLGAASIAALKSILGLGSANMELNSETGITVLNAGSLTRQIFAIKVTYEAFVSLGEVASGVVNIATKSQGVVVYHAFAVTTTRWEATGELEGVALGVHFNEGEGEIIIDNQDVSSEFSEYPSIIYPYNVVGLADQAAQLMESLTIDVNVCTATANLDDLTAGETTIYLVTERLQLTAELDDNSPEGEDPTPPPLR